MGGEVLAGLLFLMGKGFEETLADTFRENIVYRALRLRLECPGVKMFSSIRA